jgi:hypothetical protein
LAAGFVANFCLFSLAAKPQTVRFVDDLASAQTSRTKDGNNAAPHSLQRMFDELQEQYKAVRAAPRLRSSEN